MVPSTVRDTAVARVAELGPAFASRAAEHDVDATFPAANFDDLRDAGLLALCVPAEHGGMGASFADYVRVSEEIGRHCGATALTFNMHTMSSVWIGQVADVIDMTDGERAEHERRRKEVFRGVVTDGLIHSQPISEVTPESYRNPTTVAEEVTGGFKVRGKKIFASLAGAADFYDTTCVVPGEETVRFISIPADADGVSVVGDWDPLGMRGTVSRTLVFDDVFVPADNELLPAGTFVDMHARYPYPLVSIAATYLGIMGGVLDFTRDYLTAEGPAGPRSEVAQKRDGWARMQIMYHQARTMLHAVVDDDVLDPQREHIARMWAASYTVMEHAPQVASLALRICGGRAIFRSMPLERMYRDSRLGSVMLPFSAEVCLERLGWEGLASRDGGGETSSGERP